MFDRISYFEEVIDSVITVRKRSFPNSGCPRFCNTDLHLYPGIYPYLYMTLCMHFSGLTCVLMQTFQYWYVCVLTCKCALTLVSQGV